MKTHKTEKDTKWWPLIALFLVIIFLWAASGILLREVLPDWQTRGTFGDTFGFVNSLFSGMALAGVIYTILLQRKELSYQREELQLNTEELRRSADAQEKSEKALGEQSEILRKTMVYQAFAALTNEYREAQMLQAIRCLWDFYRDVGDENLVSAYITRMEEDSERVSSAPEADRVLLEAVTIHHQRRVVSQFYSRIATFIDEKIIPEDIFYSSWGETDLEIIPKILVSLENGIRQKIVGTRLPELDDASPLMQLYLKSKERSRIA